MVMIIMLMLMAVAMRITVMVTVTEVNDGNDISGDAVEAHSCIDDSTDKKFLSRK